jgi:hypothetical protein
MVHSQTSPRVWIGCAAGFAGDRSDTAGPILDMLAKHAGPRFLIFETLAERTLALAQIERTADPSRGEGAALERMVRPVIGRCIEDGVRIVGNFGAANPRAAATKIQSWAREAGYPDVAIAIVEGDDLLGILSHADFAAAETDGSVLAQSPPILAANAYLGAGPIAEALDLGAHIVVTGRVSDPSLALGPLIHAFGWQVEDWDLLAAGTLVGHILECGAQVTGGYFADPGFKDVAGMHDIGYPIAEVEADGTFTVTKPDGTGGLVDRRTVAEQLLYEIGDPSRYLTPDVVLDLSQVSIEETGRDRVRLSGARGHERPEKLKATVCIDGGYLAEAEISYAGLNATARAMLAIDVIRKRMAKHAQALPVRADAIGLVSVFGDTAGNAVAAARDSGSCRDIRVRFATETMDRAQGEILLNEVEALYCAGPAGGGGVRRRMVPRLNSASCLIARDVVTPRVSLLGGAK